MILNVRPQTLNTMVPRLLRPPHTSTNLKALGSLAEVAGPSIHNHLSHIMPVLLKTAGLVPAEKPAGAAARDSIRRVRLLADHCSSAAGAKHFVSVLLLQLPIPAASRLRRLPPIPADLVTIRSAVCLCSRAWLLPYVDAPDADGSSPAHLSLLLSMCPRIPHACMQVTATVAADSLHLPKSSVPSALCPDPACRCLLLSLRMACTCSSLSWRRPWRSLACAGQLLRPSPTTAETAASNLRSTGTPCSG